MEMESGARFLAFSIFSVRNVTGQIDVFVKQGEVYLHKYSRTKISPRFMESTFSISLQILLNNVTSTKCMCFFLFSLKFYSVGIIRYVGYFENATLSSGINYYTFLYLRINVPLDSLKSDG